MPARILISFAALIVLALGFVAPLRSAELPGTQTLVSPHDFETLVTKLEAAVAEGLLTVAAGMNVLRLAPPLIITEAEADEAVALLDRACLRMTPSKAKDAAK